MSQPLGLKRKTVSFCLAQNERWSVANMAGSILDTKETHFLGFPLTIIQQIFFLYLLPALLQTIVYIMDIATDIAIGIQLLREGFPLAGGATLCITWAPPVALLCVRLTRPPDPPSARTVLRWLAVELSACLLYPLRPLFCLAERMFWSLEALFHEDPVREEALLEYEKTRSHAVESYLFLQAFVQAGPQAILQLGLLIIGLTSNTHTEEMQALCMLCSLVSLSIVSANYHRYESQAKGGRKRVLGNASPAGSETTSLDGDPLRRAALGGSIRLPLKSRWTKAMTEDVPVGKLLLFLFWFMFLLGRLLSLGLAASFFPAVVLGVCCVHYLIFFVYILPSPKFTASLPTKLFLPFIFIFCLVEVGIQFAKPGILYTLFYLMTVTENVGLTMVWLVWSSWGHSFWYHYSLYIIGITHVLSLVFVLLYIKFYRPKVKRMRPRSQEVPEERPLNDPRSTIIY